MKNLKMFAIAIMAFAMMAMGVSAATNKVDVKVDGTTYGYATLNAFRADSLTKYTDAEKFEIILNDDDNSLADNLYFNPARFTKLTDIDVNLNGHTLDLKTTQIKVGAAQTFTVKGEGESVLKATGSSSELFNVLAGGTLSVNVAKVDATNTSIVTLAGDSVVTLNGQDWKATKIVGTVTAAAGEEAKPSLTLNGKYETTDTAIKVEHGLNVTISADIKAKTTGNVLDIDAGVVTVKSGNLVASNGDVIDFGANDKDSALHIAGGVMTAEAQGKYALNISVDTQSAKWDITAGQLNSGKKDAKTYLPAISLDDANLVDDSDAYKNNLGVISGGEFLTEIVADAKSGNATIYAADIIKHLVKEGLTVTEKEGKLGSKTVTYKVLGTDTPSDTPEEPGTTEPGDSTIPPVPQTNDNILVYAGLGLVSLASVAFTTRKRED